MVNASNMTVNDTGSLLIHLSLSDMILSANVINEASHRLKLKHSSSGA